MNKKSILLLFVVLLGGVLFFKIKKSEISPTLNVKISQNKENIYTLNDKKKSTNTKSIQIEKLYFTNSGGLYHETYGTLPFKKNFFLEINSEIAIKKSGKYIFNIYSDDGFELKIDNQKICSFQKSRPLKKTSCITSLKEGSSKIYIKYFQGYGNLGLKGFYKKIDESKFHYIGRNSKFLQFKEIK